MCDECQLCPFSKNNNQGKCPLTDKNMHRELSVLVVFPWLKGVRTITVAITTAQCIWLQPPNKLKYVKSLNIQINIFTRHLNWVITWSSMNSITFLFLPLFLSCSLSFVPSLSSLFLCPVRQCCGIRINISSIWTKSKLFISFHHINCMSDFSFVFFYSLWWLWKPKCVSYSTPQIHNPRKKENRVRNKKYQNEYKRWSKPTPNTFYLYFMCIICSELCLPNR